jgi:hypothetical protein
VPLKGRDPNQHSGSQAVFGIINCQVPTSSKDQVGFYALMGVVYYREEAPGPRTSKFAAT